MRLEYSVTRKGDNNEYIRTTYELDNARSVQAEADSSSCSVLYSSYKDSYVLMLGNELTLRISKELATQLIADLTAEVIEQGRLATEVSNNE